MRCIKNHPIAFVNFIAIELMGLAFLLSVYDGIQEDWYFALVGLSFVFGAAIFLVGSIIGIIVFLVKKAKASKQKKREKDFTQELVVEYMQKTKYYALYWITMIIFTPVLPILLVHVLDNYFLGVTVINLGIAIWMIRTFKDAMEQRFYKIRNTDEFFNITSGESSDMLGPLYGDYVHVYFYESWNEHKKDFICNILKWENALGTKINCYRISHDYLCQKYKHEYHPLFNDLILIPFSQFDLNGKNGPTFKKFFDRLSLIRFTELVDLKYGHKTSLDPHYYIHSDKEASLIPFAASITNSSTLGSELRISIDRARCADNKSKIYHDCLLVIKNAQPTGGVSTAKPQANDYIEAFYADKDAKIIDIIIAREHSLEKYDADKDSFDDIGNIHLRYSFDDIQWYWDGLCDTGKTDDILAKIS